MCYSSGCCFQVNFKISLHVATGLDTCDDLNPDFVIEI